LGNPTSRRVVERVPYTISLATYQRTLAGRASYYARERPAAMARWARRPLRWTAKTPAAAEVPKVQAP